MSEHAEDRPRAPEPPRLGVALAVFLELAIVTAFVYERSAIGLVLCVLYSYFSATRAVLFDRFIE